MKKFYLILSFLVVFSVASIDVINARTATPISPAVRVLHFDDVVVDFKDEQSVKKLYENILNSYAYRLSLFQLDQDLALQIMRAAQYEVAFVYNVNKNTSNAFPVVISFNDVTPIKPALGLASSKEEAGCVVGLVDICANDISALSLVDGGSAQTQSMTDGDGWSLSDLSLDSGWATTGAGGGFLFGTGYEAAGTFLTPLGDYDFSAGMYGAGLSQYCWEEECDPYWGDTFYDLSLDGPGPITFSYSGLLDEGFDSGEFSVGVDLFEVPSAIGAVGDFLFGD